ncbi:MAG: glycosyltransferase [Selenomonadaceae bacterium]|nr:glycosyltransferase [Selenomonadaceae bacterium]
MQNNITSHSLALSAFPAISVIIPMYNVEKYIGEMLDSLLYQTFENFEVLIVDDCSTDSSYEIVKSYVPKFKGRLKPFQLEKNSGGAGEPRNVGLNLSSGEYVIFFDSDDFILLSGLETFYKAAKEYDADVVYTSAYYNLTKPNDIYFYRDGLGRKLFGEGKPDEPMLIVDDQKKLLDILLCGVPEGNLFQPWSKLVRRELLVKNKIKFPILPNSDDFIWVINVYSYSKRFLRIQTPFYFYRRHNESLSFTKRAPKKQLSYWFSSFVKFGNALNELENRTEILKNNHEYCHKALESHFEWSLFLTEDARNKMSPQEIYEVLYNEFAEKSLDITVPFFLNFINDNHMKTVRSFETELASFKESPARPAVSVIIALYNTEKYIGECLDSVLAQTFQNFEVIVVDDCSTDSSYEIAESYAPKFNGRLTLVKMEKNSGNAGLPRNKGIMISRGEYIQFLDADDMLTKTALEEMYDLAKKYDTDVVYCEKYLSAKKSGEDFVISDVCPDKAQVQNPPYVTEPTFESENLEERAEKISKRKFWVASWNKFIRRDFVLENELFFLHVQSAEDNIWTYCLLSYAKKFLRVPNLVYIRRFFGDSITVKKRTPQQKINFCLDSVVLGLKGIDELLSKNELLKTDPSYKIVVFKTVINDMYNWSLSDAKKLPEDAIYSTIKDRFGENLGYHAVLVSALCAALYGKNITCDYYSQIINKFGRNFTARVDVHFVPKAGTSNFKIVSLSDEKAKVTIATWLPKDTIGYSIESYAGKLKIIVKPAASGQIFLYLMGLWVPNPKDTSKLVPYWTNYNKFTVNDKMIFNKLTPAWHNKPYIYILNAKAGEEIRVQLKWLMGNNEVELHDERNFIDINAEIIRKFSDYFTARVDVKLTTAVGDFKILSVSDNKALVKKAGWLKRNEIGYFIQSYVGKMDIVAKPTANGQINLDLRGLDIHDPSNRSKKIPYWVDYTKLVVNGKIIFDELTPVWHNKPFRYNLNAKADEEITINVEWQPHRDDSLSISADVAKLQEQSSKKDALIAELQSSLDNEKKIHNEDVKLFRKFSDYFTSRVDVKLIPNGGGKLQIVSVSDDKAAVKRAGWLKNNESGYFIQSYVGKMEIITKATGDGQIQFILKGIDVCNPEDKSKRVPYWVDYTKFVVNENEIFNKTTPAWHDKPYRYKLNVKADEEIKIQVEWIPHINHSVDVLR